MEKPNSNSKITKKTPENSLVNTADVVAKLKAQFLYNPIYTNIVDISNRNIEGYLDKEKYDKTEEIGLFVEARHKTINSLIIEEKQNLDINQMVEIGAGLSSRSLELQNQFATYFDTDLEDNIKNREEIKKLDSNSKVRIQELDIINPNQTIEIIKELEQKPVCVVAEGVFTYFKKDQIDNAFLNIKNMLSNGGVAIFDIATQKGLGADRSKWSEESRNLLQNFYEVSGVQKESLAFKDLREAKDYFSKIGFDVKVISLERGLEIQDLEKYQNISEEVKSSILNTPCILVCKMNRKENNLEVIKTETLKDLYNSFPENAKRFYNQYFEKDTKELYNFFDLDLQNFNLNYNKEGDIISATLTTSFPKKSQAVGGNMHGGSVAFALDASMGVPIGFAKLLPSESIMVARELSKIEILKPVPTDEEVTIEVTCEKETDMRKFWMSAVIKKGDEILAQAKSFFLKVPISNLIKEV
ncbi:MAG: class I SAM-dependent methyltransferase [Candidatus Paceibacterota bacterium]|jgi:O-methyltransferase involved in polyketide biosynthesis